jgi:hypothetical protein
MTADATATGAAIDAGRMHPIRFHSAEHQNAFDRLGYLRVPFLDDAALAELQALWQEVGPASVDGIWSNIHDLEPAVNRRIDETIRRRFAGPTAEIFADARLGGSSFLVKGTGPDSASTPHQDWNNVEEDRTLSVSIWVPLVDVDESNGALQVIPGSHRCRPSIRSLDSPSLYLDFTDDLEPYLQAVPARAGDAVLYAHNLFHGSRPNHSARIRVSAVAGVTHEQSRLVHYRHAPDGSPDAFDVFEVESDFYFSGIPDMKAGRIPPTARPAGRVEVPDHQLELADVLAAAVASRSELREERS